MRPYPDAGLPWSGRRLSLAVAAVGAIMIGVFWAGLAYHLDQRRASILDRARGDMARLSVAIDQQVTRLIAGIDDDLRAAQEAFARDPDAFDFDRWMRQENALGRIGAQIVLADEHGRVRVAKAAGTAGAGGPGVSSEPYFQALAARPDAGLYIDHTLRQARTGRYAVRLARRLTRPDGAFAGVIAIAFDAEYLTDEFRALAMGDDGCLALFGRDGYLRARSPGLDEAYDEPLTATPEGRALAERLRGADEGSLELGCLSEPGHCLFAFRNLAPLPLTVVVGKAEGEILAAFAAERRSILVVGATLSALALILIAGLLGELERRRRREIELDAVHRSLRAAHRALGEREAFLRGVFEGSADCVNVLSADGRLRFVGRIDPCMNAAAEHPPALIGRPFADLWAPSLRPGIAEAIGRAVAGEQAHVAAACRLPDGRVRHLDVLIAPIGSLCPPDHLLAVARDVTHLRSAEAALARKTALLELTLEHMDQGLLLIDSDGTVPVSNRRARELLELPAELMAGQPPAAAVREHQRRAHRWGSLLDGVPTWTLSDDLLSTDVRIVRRSADNHYLDVRTVPAGETGGVVQTFTDITDVKRAEDAERSAEALFRGLFENATDLLIVCQVEADGTFAVETINPAAAQRLERSAAAVRGCPLEAILPAPAAARVGADIGRVIETGAVHRTEDEGLGEAGHVWELVHVPLPHEAEERVGRVFVSIRDITHLRAAEAAVREKSVLLEATLENMDQGLLMIDAGGRVLVCNRRAVDLLGLPPALTASRPSLAEVTAYLDRHGEYVGVPDEIRTRIEPCLGEVRLHSYERTRPDGTVIEVRTVPLPGGGAVRTLTDITLVRRSERAVRESEARYRLLADHTSDLIVLGHADGRRSYISPAVTSLLGYSVEEAHRIGMRTWIHPNDLEAVFATTQALTSAAPTRSAVYRLRHRDGHYVWAEAAFRRVENGEGDHTVIAAIRDVSERQQRTEELKAARDAAEAARIHADRANQAKTDFLAAMSHEIRTPLNAIIGFTGLMLDAPDLPPDIRHHAENIGGSGQALLTIINDILDFSEVEAGAIRLEPRPFAPLALIDNCLSMVRGLAVNKRLEFKSTIDPDLPALIVGDEGRLRQILLNLLNNAVKFTRSGYVALGVRREAGASDRETIRFSVTDTGIGIPKDKQDRLFHDFSQVDGSIRREFGGTGLGLAITKRLVELMDGQVGIFSEEGRGSTFWFTVRLPRGSAEAGAAAGPDLAPPRRRGHLLLVEDVEVNRKLARLILEAAGHTVETVADGPSAIDAVRERAFDLVLMDVQMPGMDGMEATKAIRALPEPRGAIPIVAMTANVLPHQVRLFRAAGMDDHVGKPINRTELHAVIERWLRAAAQRPGTGEPPRAEPARFDRGVFEQLLWLVGTEAARELVANLGAELGESLAPEAGGEAEGERLRQEAHKLVPASSMLGFRALFDAVTALEAAPEGPVFVTALKRARTERDWALGRLVELGTEIGRGPPIAA